MKISEIQAEIVEDFLLFEDWMERYEYMISLGKTLPKFDPINQIDANLIKGCQSNVWLHAELIDNKMNYTANSDAIITKGIIAILIQVFTNQTPKNILEANLDFIDEIGLKEHLSPTRANGLVSMIKKIKMYALAYQTKIQS